MLVTMLTTMTLTIAPTQQSWTPVLEARLSPAYRQCMAGTDAAQGVHPAMMRCEASEFVRQDARLNAAYRAARTRLRGDERTELRDVQRRWIAARDAGCQAEYDAGGGGQISELNQSGCRLRETIARTMELERLR